MPDRKSQATVQRRMLVLESVKRLSGLNNRWVTVGEIAKDLQGQGYAAKIHNIRRDLKDLLPNQPQLECNDNSGGGDRARSGLAHGYRWAGKDMPPGAGLTVAEALSLVLVERYLSQALPVLLTRALQDIFAKAHRTLALHKKSQVTHWPEKICVIPPTQPLLPPQLDRDVLAAVHEAVLNEKQLSVGYRGGNRADGAVKAYRLHPQGLIQRGPVTYLAAMNNDYEDVRFYAVHRMLSAQLLEADMRTKADFNLADFAERKGHFGSGESISFKARVCEHLAAVLEETRLSGMQHLSAPDDQGYRELAAGVRDTWQLRWWILGEGDRIEVLEPDELRAQIVASLTAAKRIYDKLPRNIGQGANEQLAE